MNIERIDEILATTRKLLLEELAEKPKLYRLKTVEELITEGYRLAQNAFYNPTSENKENVSIFMVVAAQMHKEIFPEPWKDRDEFFLKIKD